MSQTDIYKIMRTQNRWFKVKELSESLGVRETSTTRALLKLVRYEFVEVRTIIGDDGHKINEYKISALDKQGENL